MKSEMLMRREFGFLRPDGDAAWEIFDKIPNGSTVVVTVRKTRNVDHLKKYWAICAAAADADPEWDEREDADHWVRVSVPWMREEYRLGGDRIGIRLKSINLDEMDQVAFSKFYDRAIELLSMRLGLDVEELSRNRSAQ